MLNCTIRLLIFNSFKCILTCKLFISKHTFTNCHSLDSNFENMLRFIHWNHLLSGPPRLNILFNCHLPCQHWYFLSKMPIRIFYPHNKFMLNYISCIDIIILHVNTINSQLAKYLCCYWLKDVNIFILRVDDIVCWHNGIV